ncbi:MAG: hypothetical protein ACE5FH_10805 [Candidatus Zixiibacteriota bacterium]
MLAMFALVVLCWLPEVGRSQSVDSSDSQLTDVVADSSAVVTIDRVAVDNGRINDTLDVRFESSGRSIAAFDLKIAAQGRWLEIIEILPGALCDSCDWEFFNAHDMSAGLSDGEPSALWQVVAIADITPDTNRAPCYGIEKETSLCRLVVTNDRVADQPDTVVPVFFYWEDCSDNTMADVSGDLLYISRQVSDYFPTDNTEWGELFPRRTGAPLDCISPSAINKPLRAIDFRNGGVGFQLSVDITAPDSVTPDSQ